MKPNLKFPEEMNIAWKQFEKADFSLTAFWDFLAQAIALVDEGIIDYISAGYAVLSATGKVDGENEDLDEIMMQAMDVEDGSLDAWHEIVNLAK